MKFGVHVSVSGGFDQALERAAGIGCDCFQMFVSNPRSWAPAEIDPVAAETFQESRKNLALGPVVVHVTYLPNLASPEDSLFKKSRNHLGSQYAVSAALGAEFFVIHPGSHKGSGLDAGIARIAEGLRLIFDKTPAGPMLLLENTAGGGNTIGRNPEELAAIAEAVDTPERIGLCLDTCHAYAMGVDVAAKGGFKKFVASHTELLGKNSLQVVHANDSMFKLGAGRDRHQHIGLGEIGEKGFREILSTSGIKKVPFILETPVNEERDDAGNLAAIRALAAKKTFWKK
ncbi:MAG: deoxyribonuclease IV [Planctomycetes bacterium]|nr:deoxyribonuclease IV [Planctomycetota bacterium]